MILATILSMVMSSTLAMAADAPKILLVLRDVMPQYIDTMLTKEVSVMKSMLENASFKVVVATTDGLPIKGPTVTLTPNLKLSDVKVDDYAGIIIPCSGGGTTAYTSVSPIAVSIVKQAITQGKPVAASHGSVIILAEAGVLADKRYTFFESQLRDFRFTGAIFGSRGLCKMGISLLVVFALRFQPIRAGLTALLTSFRH